MKNITFLQTLKVCRTNFLGELNLCKLHKYKVSKHEKTSFKR